MRTSLRRASSAEPPGTRRRRVQAHTVCASPLAAELDDRRDDRSDLFRDLKGASALRLAPSPLNSRETCWALGPFLCSMWSLPTLSARQTN
jgi:hypothetical protein